ncbi:MAG TPA: nuclear transport factor 2 family protein [Chloroflexota bacterium]|jgi:hypothetical protein|nr:nuclear transport factor 2 family protein [Chloroflexota bacterium]
MQMTHEHVDKWLTRYVEAWQSYDPNEVKALFTEDATYAYRPWDDPLRGRAAILASWLVERDAPGSWSATYECVMVADDQAVATGRTDYFGGDGALEKRYHNCFLVRFDEDGTCSSFVEWYMRLPSPA